MTISNDQTQTNPLSDLRIAVVGIGGVGGYLGAMLASAFPHVSFAARGARMEALQKDGLVLHSDHNGKIAARPARIVKTTELGVQDLIFVCVKNYSLKALCEELKGAVAAHTIIVPVMNGVDPAARIRNLLGQGTVVEALIYIVAFLNADGSVSQQGDFADLRIGIQNASNEQRRQVALVSAVLSAAHIDHRCADDIEAEVWRKYILNCAYNVATARYDNTIGQLRDDPKKAAEYEALVREATAVAIKKGVQVTKDDADAIIHRFYHELAYDATSSLQRDVRAKRPSELETFSGYIVQNAAQLGIDAPVSREMYEALKMQCAGAAL